jgi:hypothetical protein
MASDLHRFLVSALLCACAALVSAPAVAADATCTATAKHPVSDARILRAIDEARRQHQLFGGQVIERDGGLYRVGYHEAEWSRAPGETTGAWQRVATFWRALSDSEPAILLTSAGWVARSEAMRDAGAEGAQGKRADLAVREALLRAAIVDVPWSAAFISYLMKTAGFSPAEFTFSDSHVDYVQAAYEASAAEAAGQPSGYAFRACDVATTRPRAGDLLCATRAATAGVARFDALATALSTRQRGEAFPMHCELVVRADEGGDAKIETIGGNVVQSVTLSRMTLNTRKVLGAAYIGQPAAAVPCPRGAPSCRGSLSRRPWAVLLQFRP